MMGVPSCFSRMVILQGLLFIILFCNVSLVRGVYDVEWVSSEDDYTAEERVNLFEVILYSNNITLHDDATIDAIVYHILATLQHATYSGQFSKLINPQHGVSSLIGIIRDESTVLPRGDVASRIDGPHRHSINGEIEKCWYCEPIFIADIRAYKNSEKSNYSTDDKSKFIVTLVILLGVISALFLSSVLTIGYLIIKLRKLQKNRTSADPQSVEAFPTEMASRDKSGRKGTYDFPLNTSMGHRTTGAMGMQEIDLTNEGHCPD